MDEQMLDISILHPPKAFIKTNAGKYAVTDINSLSLIEQAKVRAIHSKITRHLNANPPTVKDELVIVEAANELIAIMVPDMPVLERLALTTMERTAIMNFLARIAREVATAMGMMAG